MKIRVLSDLHFEYLDADGREFLDYLDPRNADVLVVAGDIHVNGHINDALDELCEKFPEVIYVKGNHELYLQGLPEEKIKTRSNLHFLENEVAEIDGVCFVGATLWFPKPVQFDRYFQRMYNNFMFSYTYDPIAFDRHEKTLEFLDLNLKESDVLVTHFMPFKNSIDQKFSGSPMNCFFWSGERAENLIRSKKPRLVIHGHTHNEFRYTTDGIEVVCNPAGYPYKVLYEQENPWFDPNLTVEV